MSVVIAVVFLGWLLAAAFLIMGSCAAELGEGCVVSFNGRASDETLCEDEEDDLSWLVGLWGVIIGRCPHETGNGPGDELWRVRLPAGDEVELWAEEMDVRCESAARVWLRSRFVR
jgi:hypothetical protein